MSLCVRLIVDPAPCAGSACEPLPFATTAIRVLPARRGNGRNDLLHKLIGTPRIGLPFLLRGAHTAVQMSLRVRPPAGPAPVPREPLPLRLRDRRHGGGDISNRPAP
ncbi:hypothetical protein [Paracoccus solventivorans]|uniref:hypothetical protein n=1 Tax=Paracoccus solventivorans TaxID=53463 RepID=UPI001160CD14|nr:hypothetical protein [Paracoccus solventivorans]